MFCSTWSFWTNVLWHAQRSEAGTSLAVREIKTSDELCYCITGWPAPAGCRGGEGLMIASLPRCQVHLDFLTCSCELVQACLSVHEKPTGKNVLAHTAYRKSIFCLVMRFIANEEEKHTAASIKICKPNRVFVHTDTFLTFQSTLQTWEQLRRKTDERWIFSVLWENYRDVSESVPHWRRAREIISDCMGTELHMYTQSTNYTSLLIQRNKQRTKVHRINKSPKHLSVFSCQITV